MPTAKFFYEKINFEKRNYKKGKYAEAGFLNIEGKYQEAIGYALEYEKWTKRIKRYQAGMVCAVSMLATYREWSI